jgi:hypothetical protein
MESKGLLTITVPAAFQKGNPKATCKRLVHISHFFRGDVNQLAYDLEPRLISFNYEPLKD